MHCRPLRHVRLRLAAVVTTAALLLASCGNESEAQLLASARAYLDKRESAAAVIQLKRALDKNPESIDARVMLGKALLLGGDPTGAAVELRKAVASGAPASQAAPDLARAMLLLAQAGKITSEFGAVTLSDDPEAQADLRTTVAAAHAQQGQLEQAQKALTAALATRPQYAPAIMVQARLKAASGDVDAALRLIDGLLAADPGNEQAGVAKGYVLLLGKSDLDGALAAHRRVLATKPQSVGAQSEVISILFRQGKTEESRRAFVVLQKMAPEHPQTAYFEAQFAYVDKRYGQSREVTDQLLKIAPDHVRALELAAAAEYQLGNDAQAQAFLARALKVVPDLVLSRQLLAQSLLRTGHPVNAIEALSPLLDSEGVDAESLMIAGSAYIQAGEPKKADAAFKRAAALAPRSAKLRTEAALAMLSSGNGDVAMRELEAVAAGDAGPRADLALISALISKQDWNGALKAIAALEIKTPAQALPHQLRGQVMVAMRNADGAQRSFMAALQKDPKYFPASAALASMDQAAGKSELARKRLNDFLRASPNDSRAMVMLAALSSASGAPVDDALKHLADAVRASPNDSKMRLALTAGYLQVGDRRSALTSAQAAVAALPNDLGILEALGQLQLLVGETYNATSTFKKLTALAPLNAGYQVRLAEVHLAVRNAEAAGTALTAAVALDPKLGEARRALAMLALQGNRLPEAMAIARALQKERPTEALGYAVEGDIEVKQKNWTAAASAYRAALQRTEASEAAIKLHASLRAGKNNAAADRLAADWETRHPNDPAFRFYLGDVATRNRSYDAAEAHYRAVLARQPGNALAMNNVAWLMQKQSTPGALEMAQKANARLPNRAPILDTLASIQASSGKLTEALATQQMAIGAAPEDPNLKLTLARYLIKADRKTEARQALQVLSQLGSAFSQQAEVARLLSSL